MPRTNDIIRKNTMDDRADFTLYGHDLKEVSNGLSCVTCDTEAEIPEIFQQSTGFREVVYKFYIIGQYKKLPCSANNRVRKFTERRDKKYSGIPPYDSDRVNYINKNNATF